ncbi:MAG: 2-oxo acid dehydrogenase subunit E2 [Myxococcota bacterium]
MPHQVEVRVPDVGEAEQVEVIEVLVAAGDRVAVDDVIVTLESDKATLELPSPRAGVVQSVGVAVGDEVVEGTLLLVLEVEPDEATADAAAAATTEAEEPAGGDAVRAGAAPAPHVPSVTPPTFTPQAPPVPASAARGAASGERPHAGPQVRRMARELGLDLAAASGSGPHGRILEDDVRAAVRTALSGTAARDRAALAAPNVDYAKYGEVEEVELSRIRRVSARNLARSWALVPHVTQHDEADVTELEAFRKARAAELAEEGVRLSPLVFALKATALVLRRFPRMRSSLLEGGERIAVKHYVHVGVAVDTEGGLVVPVVRDVDRKGLRTLAREVAELAERARERKLRPEHFEGAVFSISSLGGIGGTAFTPIVNHPEVGILGLSRLQTKPVWDREAAAFAPRTVLPLSLSYDHRVIDGAEAVRFTTDLARTLAHPANLLL